MREQYQQNFVHLYIEYVKFFSEGTKTGDLALSWFVCRIVEFRSKGKARQLIKYLKGNNFCRN